MLNHRMSSFSAVFQPRVKNTPNTQKCNIHCENFGYLFHPPSGFQEKLIGREYKLMNFAS